MGDVELDLIDQMYVFLSGQVAFAAFIGACGFYLFLYAFSDSARRRFGEAVTFYAGLGAFIFCGSFVICGLLIFRVLAD
jgi:hypothetical protein